MGKYKKIIQVYIANKENIMDVPLYHSITDAYNHHDTHKVIKFNSFNASSDPFLLELLGYVEKVKSTYYLTAKGCSLAISLLENPQMDIRKALLSHL